MSSVVIFAHGAKAEVFVPLFEQMMNTQDVPVGPRPYISITKIGAETKYTLHASGAVKTVPEMDDFHVVTMPAEPSYDKCMEKAAHVDGARTAIVFVGYNDVFSTSRAQMEKANPRQALILAKDNPTAAEVDDYMQWDRVFNTNDSAAFNNDVRNFAQDIKTIINRLFAS